MIKKSAICVWTLPIAIDIKDFDVIMNREENDLYKLHTPEHLIEGEVVWTYSMHYLSLLLL